MRILAVDLGDVRTGLAAGEDLGPVYGKGFVHTGLWGRSRHPNYACEQSIWVVFYLFTGAATGEWQVPPSAARNARSMVTH